MPDVQGKQRFVLDLEPGGSITVSQLTGGDFSSATLTSLLSVTREISTAVDFLKYLIERNLT